MFTPLAYKKITDICSECFFSNQDNVDAKDIDISKGQARFLKSIAKSIPKGKDLTKFSLQKALRDKSETLHFINENWGNSEHFIKLALDHKNSNPISLILYFLELQKKLNEVPTKEKMIEFSKFSLSEYESRFGSWEEFLELLGFDPWYRNDSNQKQVSKFKPSKRKLNKKIEIDLNDYFTENESQTDILEKVNNLRKQIQSSCKKKDLEENPLGYSYEKMFQLLEVYLKLLPNDPKYGHIRNYF